MAYSAAGALAGLGASGITDFGAEGTWRLALSRVGRCCQHPAIIICGALHAPAAQRTGQLRSYKTMPKDNK